MILSKRAIENLKEDLEILSDFQWQVELWSQKPPGIVGASDLISSFIEKRQTQHALGNEPDIDDWPILEDLLREFEIFWSSDIEGSEEKSKEWQRVVLAAKKTLKSVQQKYN